jgi:hypothetical protein
MRLALVALALALPAASSAEAPVRTRPGPAAVPSRLCGDDLKVREARSPEAQRLKRLGELPSGDLTLTVVNRVGDCIEPVVVRQGIGAGAR